MALENLNYRYQHERLVVSAYSSNVDQFTLSYRVCGPLIAPGMLSGGYAKIKEQIKQFTGVRSTGL